MGTLDRLEEGGIDSPLYRMLLHAEWNSLKIDYHPPFVDRLWTTWRGAADSRDQGCRVYLHRLHPCKPTEALLHSHPWPSAMHVLNGRYEMGLGHGVDEPVMLARMVVGVDRRNVNSGFRYEMTDPAAWHYVRPIGGPALSVMVTGAPWFSPTDPRNKPAQLQEKLKPLSPTEVSDLLEEFKRTVT